MLSNVPSQLSLLGSWLALLQNLLHFKKSMQRAYATFQASPVRDATDPRGHSFNTNTVLALGRTGRGAYRVRLKITAFDATKALNRMLFPALDLCAKKEGFLRCPGDPGIR
jgi:hypothetical protein